MDVRRSRIRSCVALALVVPVPSLGTAAAMWLAPGLIGQAIYGFAKLWLLLFPAVWSLAVDREPWNWLPARRGIRTGAALRLTIGLGILLAYQAAGGAWIDSRPVRQAAMRSGLANPAVYLALALYLIFINSLAEEYVWRWFVFRKCQELMPSALAVFVSAGLFTNHHVIALRVQFNSLVTIAASLGVCAGGVIWSWCFLRYRSIWPGYVCHAIVDAAILAVGWRILFG